MLDGRCGPLGMVCFVMLKVFCTFTSTFEAKMLDDSVSPEAFFDDKLMPLFRGRRKDFAGLELKIHVFKTPVVGEQYVEYFVQGPKLKWIGFDPWGLREADNDDPKRILAFLASVANGKLHPSCWQYLLGMVTRTAIASGYRPGFGALIKEEGKAAGSMNTFLDNGFQQALDLKNDKIASAKRLISLPTFDKNNGDGHEDEPDRGNDPAAA